MSQVDAPTVGGAYASPASYIIGTAIDVLSGKYHRRSPNAAQSARLESAGYRRVVETAGKGRIVYWEGPDGSRLGPYSARSVARNLPRLDPNVPAPAGASAAPFIVGSIFYGSKGPRTRKRPKKRKRTTDRYGGWPGGPVCGTDSQCAEWARDHGVPDEARGSPADWLPPPAPVQLPTRAPRVLRAAVAVLARFPILTVLWPSRTADDDVWSPVTQPQPQPLPRGPTRRPRIGTRVDVVPGPGPRVWKWPSRWPEMPPTSSPTSSPTPTRAPVPTSAPVPTIITGPIHAPAPRPIPTPTSAPLDFTWLTPFLPLALRPGRPRVPSKPSLRPTPLTPIQASPLEFARPAESDPCKAQRERERRKRKRRCTNPVTSRRVSTRGGVKYLTTTRKLQCRV